jgi:hypothetical protein
MQQVRFDPNSLRPGWWLPVRYDALLRLQDLAPV